MNRTRLIIIAIAAFLGLWMFSQSGKASTAIGDAVHSDQISSDAPMLIES